MPDGTHRCQTARHLYGRLGSDRPPVDLVVVTEWDILAPPRWLAHAESDLAVARAVDRPGVLTETLCFHA